MFSLPVFFDLAGVVASLDLIRKLIMHWPKRKNKKGRDTYENALIEQEILGRFLDNLSKKEDIMERAGFTQEEIKKAIKKDLLTPLNEIIKYRNNGILGDAEFID